MCKEQNLSEITFISPRFVAESTSLVIETNKQKEIQLLY